MNKFRPKQGKINCKTCHQPATITLRTPEDEKEFQTYKKGFNCGPCAIKFWDEKIDKREIIFGWKSEDFKEQYWAKKRKLNHD